MTNVYGDARKAIFSGRYDGSVANRDKKAVYNFMGDEVKYFFLGKDFAPVDDAKKKVFTSDDYCDFSVRPTNISLANINNRVLVLANGMLSLFEVSKYEGLLITSETGIEYESISGDGFASRKLVGFANRDTNIYSERDSKMILEKLCDTSYPSDPYEAHKVVFIATDDMVPLSTIGSHVTVTRNVDRLVESIEYSCNKNGIMTDSDIYMDGRRNIDPLIKMSSDLTSRDTNAVKQMLFPKGK